MISGMSAELPVETDEQADDQVVAQDWAKTVEKGASDLLMNANLDFVRKNMPEMAGLVEELMAEIDPLDPMSIARFGGWALDGQIEASLASLSAVQADPDNESLVRVAEFEANVLKHVAPLQKRLNARSSKTVWQKGSQLVKTAWAVTRDPFGKKKNERMIARLHADLNDLKETNTLLNGIVTKTVQDTLVLNRLLEANKHLPTIIQDEAKQSGDNHKETAEKLFLSLAAINTVNKEVAERRLPSLADKINSGTFAQDDLDQHAQLAQSVGILETKATDLSSAFLMANLLRAMGQEMGNVNAKSALEIERLQSTVVPQLVGLVGTLSLQQRTSELQTLIIYGQRVLTQAVAGTAAGFKSVLKQCGEVDKAICKSAGAVVAAVDTSIKAVQEYRKNEARYVAGKREVRKQVSAAYDRLRKAGSRMPSQALPQGTTLSGAEKVAYQVTGVLPEADDAQAPASQPQIASVKTVSKAPSKFDELYGQSRRPTSSPKSPVKVGTLTPDGK